MYSLYLIFALIFVGLNVVIGKIIVEEVPVNVFSTIRFFIGTILLFIISRKRSIQLTITKPERKLLFLQALFGSFLFSIFILNGVKHTSGANAGIITSLTPAITAVIAYFFLREKLNNSKIISICIAICGIWILSSEQNSATSSLTGDSLIFIAVICEASFVTLSRKSALNLDPIRIAL